MRMSRKRSRKLSEERKEEENLPPAFPNMLRMTRQRRRRLWKRRLAEGPVLPAFPRSLRMTRRRRQRLQERREEEGPVLPTFPHFTRMTRQRKRQMRDRDELSRDMTQVAAASVSTIYVMQSTPLHTHASSVNTFTDISSHFDYMRDARERILGRKIAEENADRAREARVQAHRDVLYAENDLLEAVAAVNSAEEQLNMVGQQQSKIRIALCRARGASESRTRTAIECQQAVADFLPKVYAQQAEVNRLVAVASEYEGEYHARQSELSVRVERKVQERQGPTDSRRAEVIEETWKSVDYAQNRLNDVRVMVEDQLAGESEPVYEETVVETAVPEEAESELRYYEERMSSAMSEADEAQEVLDSLEAQLDALRNRMLEAENAEADVRQEVLALEQDQKQTDLDRREAEEELRELKRKLAEAQVFLQDAEKSEKKAVQEQIKAEYELEHFGEGHSYGLGIEYYSWHGSEDGHQLYMPMSVSGEEDGWDWSMETGYVNSSSGKPEGNVSGWTSTELSATVRNDHPVNDVRYKMTVSVPTGPSRVHENAGLPDDLARHSSFGEGWKVTPAIEATRHITERDSITGRMSWTWQGDYEFRWNPEGPGEPSETAKASPGNLWTQEAEYLHAGEHHQFLGLFTHQSSTSARAADHSYRDGDIFTWKAFYSKDVSPKDSLQAYGILSYTAGKKGIEHGGNVWRQYYGLGWRHEIRKDQSWWIMMNYMKSKGWDYDFSSRQPTSDRNRWSLQLGYDHQLSEKSLLRLKLERYSMRDKAAGNFQGWNTSVMFYQNF